MFKLLIPTRNIFKLYRHRSTKYLFLFNLCLFIYAIYIYGSSAPHENELGNGNRRYSKRTSLIRYYSLLAESVGVFQFMDKMRKGAGGDTSDKVIEAEKIQNVWCNFLWLSPVEKPRTGTISNRFWQKMDGKSDIYLFSAYFDRRFDQRTPAASSFVRILGVVWSKLDLDVYCHIWWKGDDKPIIVKAIGRLIWLEHWDPRRNFYNTYLFTCPLVADARTETMSVPAFVSLTSEKCATNLSNLLTIYDGRLQKEDKQKKQIVVCVKGLDFLDDISLQLIEWFEANYIFGADKIVVYSYNVHPNVQKVLNFYANSRFENETDNGDDKFQFFSISLPGRTPDENFLARSSFIRRNRQQKRRDELISYNDCVYRHINSHEFALIIDIDELAVPQQPFRNWSQVLDEVAKKMRINLANSTAFSLINAYFMENFTDWEDSKWKFSASKRRSVILSPKGFSGKSFMRLENVLTVFNHYPLHLLRHRQDLFRMEVIPPALALKNHYRKSCPTEITHDECNKYFNWTVGDSSLSGYDIVQNSQHVLNRIKIT